MAEPVVTPPLFARPSQFRDFLGVSAYLRDLHRTLTLGLSRFADALNTGVAQYGTWTPTITASSTAGTPSYDKRLGRYTLRGADVTVWGEVDLAGWTGSPAGDVAITGFPFTHTDVTDIVVPLVTEARNGVNLTANYTQAMLVLTAGGSAATLVEIGDNVAQLNVQASAVATTAIFRFWGTYRTNLT